MSDQKKLVFHSLGLDDHQWDVFSITYDHMLSKQKYHHQGDLREIERLRGLLEDAQSTLMALRIRLHAAGRRPEECYEMRMIDDCLGSTADQPPKERK